jgi:hypothetical protein
MIPIYFPLEFDDLFQGRGLAIGCRITTTRGPLPQKTLDGALTRSQPSLNLAGLASDEFVDALEFGVEDGEEIAFEFAGAAGGGGRLLLDQQLDLVVVEVVRAPLRDRTPGQRRSKLHRRRAGTARGWSQTEEKRVVDRQSGVNKVQTCHGMMGKGPRCPCSAIRQRGQDRAVSCVGEQVLV